MEATGEQVTKKEVSKTDIKRSATLEIGNLLKGLPPEGKTVDKKEPATERALKNVQFLNTSLKDQPNFTRYLEERERAINLSEDKASIPLQIMTGLMDSGPDAFCYQPEKGVMFWNPVDGGTSTEPTEEVMRSISITFPNTLNKFANMSKEALLKKVLKSI